MGNANLVGDVHRLIAFDLDGTLVDSRLDLADSANELIEELRGTVLSEEAVGAMVGEGAATLVRRALAASGVKGVEATRVLPRFLEIYDRRLLRHTGIYDGIAEAVQYARVCAHLVVLTNKPTGPSERILQSLGLRESFDEVIGGDGPWPRKPDPSSLEAAMARSGATPQCTLLIGDSAVDRETATRASARWCMAAYGFGAHTLGRVLPVPPEWVATAPSGIPAVIDQFTAGC